MSCVTFDKSSKAFADIGVMQQQIQSDLLQYRVRLENKESTAIVDTGAQISLISKDEAKRLNISWQTNGRKS